MFPHGIWHYLIGGALLGVAMGVLYGVTGLAGGMSSVFSTTWTWFSQLPGFRDEKLVRSRGWRTALAVGVLLGGVAFLVASRGEAAFVTGVPAWRLLAGGVLVGFGARLGGGCTSGHGVCGMSSFQWPSIVAVITFMATGMAVAHLVAALGGAP